MILKRWALIGLSALILFSSAINLVHACCADSVFPASTAMEMSDMHSAHMTNMDSNPSNPFFNDHSQHHDGGPYKHSELPNCELLCLSVLVLPTPEAIATTTHVSTIPYFKHSWNEPPPIRQDEPPRQNA